MTKEELGLIKMIGLGILAGILIIIGLNSYTIISTGHKGVVVLFGKVDEKNVLSEGLHIVNPLTNIIEIDVRRQKESFKTQPYTKDVQTATIDVVFTYSLNPTGVASLYKNFGDNWKDKLINPVLQTSLKNVIGKWEASDLVENRSKAIEQINNSLKERLNGKYVLYDSFDLINIDYSDAFEKSIEEKQIATQDAIKEKNNTVKINEKAKQQVISAEAEAKAMRIKTKALSQNKALIDYEAVQKWDGHLPTTTGGVIPFLKVGK